MASPVLNPDGSVPLPGSFFPSPYGWPSLPNGLAGMRGVETYGSAVNLTGESWGVVVGSPAWDYWVRMYGPDKPVKGPKPPTYQAPGYQSAFEVGAVDGSGDVGIKPIQMPAVVPAVLPPVQGSIEGPAIEGEPDACACQSGLGARSIWWLILGGLFLWIL
jgi:hypothetical protein